MTEVTSHFMDDSRRYQMLLILEVPCPSIWKIVGQRDGSRKYFIALVYKSRGKELPESGANQPEDDGPISSQFSNVALVWLKQLDNFI